MSKIKSLKEEFQRIKKQYLENPSLDENIETMAKQVSKMLANGILNHESSFYFDRGIEKFRTTEDETGLVEVTDRTDTIRIIASNYYGGKFIPKSLASISPIKRTVFTPHGLDRKTIGGIEVHNLFKKNEYLSIKRSPSNTIKNIEWDKFPTCKLLFDNVFPKKEELDYFINWLAFGCQTLTKTRTSVVSRGVQRTGKGAIFNKIVKRLYQEQYTTTITQTILQSNFNGWAENVLFVLANEVKEDIKHGNSTGDKIKMYIADEDIKIENKGIKGIDKKNYFNMWFHSNKEIPMALDTSDGRISIFNTTSKTINELAREKGLVDASTFMQQVDKEAHGLCVQIMLLDTDESKAIKPLLNREKKEVIVNSTSRCEGLCTMLQERDEERIMELCENMFMDKQNELDAEKDSRETKISIRRGKFIVEYGDPISLLDEIMSQISTDTIIFSYLYALYCSHVGTKTVNQTARDVTKFIGGSINKKGIKYRKLYK